MKVFGFPLWAILVGLAAACAALFALHVRQTLDSGFVAERWERRLLKTGDPNIIQSWSLAVLSAEPGKQAGLASPNNFPSGLASTWDEGRPHALVRFSNRTEDDHILFIWGSGVLGHWGLAVGHTNLNPVVPGQVTKKWIEGVYIWKDLH